MRTYVQSSEAWRGPLLLVIILLPRCVTAKRHLVLALWAARLHHAYAAYTQEDKEAGEPEEEKRYDDRYHASAGYIEAHHEAADQEEHRRHEEGLNCIRQGPGPQVDMGAMGVIMMVRHEQ